MWKYLGVYVHEGKLWIGVAFDLPVALRSNIPELVDAILAFDQDPSGPLLSETRGQNQNSLERQSGQTDTNSHSELDIQVQ